MLRRLLCLLLIAALLANQGLLAVHAHPGGGASRDGQSHRPHFHWGGHGHAHSHGDHSHTHCAACRCATDSENESNGLGVSEPVEHNADAVYLVELVATRTASQADQAAVMLDSSALLIASQHPLLKEGQLHNCLLSDSASHYNDACPIYLRTLSLRI